MTDAEQTWIQCYSGGRFYPLEPEDEHVDLVDIAHALGNVCRFNGHCRRFYSVAEHSVHVSRRSAELAQADGLTRKWAARVGLYGLLHDAAEAYLGDIVSPVKWQLAEIDDVERWIRDACFVGLGMVPGDRDGGLPFAVVQADRELLAAERLELYRAAEPWPGLEGVEPAGQNWIRCWGPEWACERFQQTFWTLAGPAELETWAGEPDRYLEAGGDADV